LGGHFLITTNVDVDQTLCTIIIDSNRNTKILKLPSKMPIYVEKNMRYAHFAEIRENAKYVAIAYLH